MFNLTSNTAKKRHMLKMNRQMVVLENAMFRKVRPILRAQYTNVASSVRSGGVEVSYEVEKESLRIRKVLEEFYRRSGAVFGDSVFKEYSDSKSSVHPLEIKTPRDEFWSTFRNWVSQESAKKVTKINNTTKGLLRSIILKKAEEGLGNRDIAKEIVKIKDLSSGYRAMRIARTETHTASVESVDAAVASLRVEMEREWVSSRDDRTRRKEGKQQFDHYHNYPAGANGEVRGMKEDFTGTGESLSKPGDPNGSAGNIIGCRCFLIYREKGRVEGDNQEVVVLKEPATGLTQKQNDYEEFKREMREKYGEEIWSGMSNSEMERWEELEREFFHLKKQMEEQILSEDIFKKRDKIGEVYTTEEDLKKAMVSVRLDYDQIDALNTYTDIGGYEKLNKALRSGKLDPDSDLGQLSGRLSSALKDSPHYEGKVYRGMSFSSEKKFNSFVKSLDPKGKNKEVVFKGYTSCTLNSKMASNIMDWGVDPVKETYHNYGVKLVIKSKTGAWSKFNQENPDIKEVIFDKNSKFRVLKNKTVPYRNGKALISYLEEILS